ncbi:MAG: polyphosphate kinase 2 [Hyphomicrobiaceae bacterium]|nr:polyphosphate kinase 2 [Hyphomicrobiaceae bacterium]
MATDKPKRAGKSGKKEKPEAVERAEKGSTPKTPSPVGGSASAFDIDNPRLPDGLEAMALSAGGYPYEKEMKREKYEDALEALQVELLKLQSHIRKTGERLVVLFEGRDSAGKGGCITRFMQHLNPRHARAVALTKPTETERGQWYFQRYVPHLPTAGDIVLFDRSWYNRAGVERVMGFCTQRELANFLRDAPQFESLLVQDGIKLIKLFLTIGRETQMLRFHERRHDPLKQWKLTEIDLAALGKWNDYTEAQHEMFRFTHTPETPWTVVRANDQRRARLEVIRYVLSQYDYEGKDRDVADEPDPKIVGSTDDLLYGA